MDKTKQWLALALVAALVVLTGGWLLAVAPTRTHAAELREQAELQESTNAQLTTALDVLREKAERLPEKRAEVAESARRIPDGPELPDLLRALAGAAASAGVELSSVTPTAPGPVETAAAAAAPVVPVDPAAAPDPAAAAAAAVPTAPDLSAMDVTMVVVGDFYAVEQFLVLLEELPRALRVTSLSMTPGSAALSEAAASSADGRSVEATLTGRVFLAGGAGTGAGGTADAVPGAPAAPAPAMVPAPSTASVS